MRGMAAHSRRGLLKSVAALLPSFAGVLPKSDLYGFTADSVRITDVILDLDNLHKWDNSNGDTWDPFWADDDNLYAFNCDGRGFGQAPRNLAFNRLEGDSPDNLTGAMVNTMDEYGASGKKEADNATWKACGQECIDGVFYAFVSRNAYGMDSGDYWLRQTAFNSSLIKSTDRGLTWGRGAAENYKRPMWPGPSFGAPFFIHYGKNGGSVARDGADRYVYAASTNGFWNDGDRYILGRVPREKLPDLNAGDWRYFAGSDGDEGANWSRKIQDAKPIFESRTHCGQSVPCYIPALGLYLMVVWYNTEKMIKWFEPNEMRYDFYQAPHPWGPWGFIRGYSDRFISSGHMYGPSLCARFQRSEGTDVHMTLFTSGCPFEDVPGGLYKAWEIPIIVRISPLRRATAIPGSDPRIVYEGKWAASGEARRAFSANASAELSFRGTGIDVTADKSTGAGVIHIYLDGALIRTANLAIEHFPGLRGVTVFRSGALGEGSHTIRVVSDRSDPAVLDGFQVYTADRARKGGLR
jgi:hypothetical protein